MLSCFSSISNCLKHFENIDLSKVFLSFLVYFIIYCFFEYWIRILCIFLYMGTYSNDLFQHVSTNKSKRFPEVWTIFARNILGNMLGIVGPKWSPYVAEEQKNMLREFEQSMFRLLGVLGNWSPNVHPKMGFGPKSLKYCQ